MSIAQTGHAVSDEAKQRMRKAKLGRKQSADHIAARTGNQKGRTIKRPKGIWNTKTRAFSNTQVREMRQLKKLGSSYSELAKRYGKNATTIHKAVTGKSYQDVQ